ncbi:MAG: PAS domain S-box protein [Verrucomicrobia bacterium]|nr:PAS domain S-box protein [Verrucomicrobiota bacterium]
MVGENASVPETTNQRLPDNDAVYREVYNNTSDAIFLHDPVSGMVLDVNRAALEMYGCTREQIVGHHIELWSDGKPPHSASAFGAGRAGMDSSRLSGRPPNV